MHSDTQTDKTPTPTGHAEKRYDTIRDAILTCAQKLAQINDDDDEVSLIYRTVLARNQQLKS